MSCCAGVSNFELIYGGVACRKDSGLKSFLWVQIDLRKQGRTECHQLSKPKDFVFRMVFGAKNYLLLLEISFHHVFQKKPCFSWMIRCTKYRNEWWSRSNMFFASPFLVFLGCVIWFDYHCGLGLLQEMSLAFVFLGAGKPFLWKILRSCADVFCCCGKRPKKFSPPGRTPKRSWFFTSQ